MAAAAFGPAFQSVTLTATRMTRAGRRIWGDRLQPTLVSQATQNSPTPGERDFDLATDAAIFQLTRTDYVEATVVLVFSNTGVLTRSLHIPQGQATLGLGGVVLMALEGRQAGSGSSPQMQADGSSTVLLRASVPSTSSVILTMCAHRRRRAHCGSGSLGRRRGGRGRCAARGDGDSSLPPGPSARCHQRCGPLSNRL